MSADVQGRCPSCGSKSLFLGSGGYVTCRVAECPDPGRASDYLERGPAIKELLDSLIHQAIVEYARSRAAA